MPVPGGFDREGALTHDPAAIEASRRPLPIGFWKGSGLALMLDMAAALLAGGRSTHEIPQEQETGLSQVFLAFDVAAIAGRDETTRVVDAILADLRVRYPGERAFDARRQNLKDGIPVEPSAWRIVESAAAS